MRVHHTSLPDVWGADQLMAFSGLEGHTDWSQPFVLHTGREPASFQVRLPGAAHVGFSGLPALRFTTLLGDALAADSDGGAFRAAFLDHHALVGEMPAGAQPVLNLKPVGDQPCEVALPGGYALLCAVRGRRWALVLVPAGAPDAVAPRLDGVMAADLDAVFDQRAAFVRDFPAPAGLSPARERLLRKALSVMKVNIEAPCGHIRRRWTTPDRWPHRHMWLWDSAFHAVGLSYVDPGMAQDAVLAMLEQVRGDGMLPHMVPAGAPPSDITQPPILAWATLCVLRRLSEDGRMGEWENGRAGAPSPAGASGSAAAGDSPTRPFSHSPIPSEGARTWAAQCVPYLFRYLEWMRLNRDRNDNALPEWHIHGDPLCRSGESGLDNSPRFDHAVELDAVDFASFLANDYRCLASLAEYVGEPDVQAACLAHAESIAVAVNELLWCPDEEFYFDRDFQGCWTGVKAVSGFLPLFAGIADPAQAAALRRHLHNPSTFGAALPIPSVSLDSGQYCKDMWRGPTWMNLNYVTIVGLRANGFPEDAARLKEASLAAIQQWYEREGCIFEYYDSLGITSPRGLDRKQRLATGRGIAPISDYHWTAAITAALLLEDESA